MYKDRQPRAKLLVKPELHKPFIFLFFYFLEYFIIFGVKIEVKSKMNRKAQSEVITTFALILIVLAAIAIVWYIVDYFMWNRDPFTCSDVNLKIVEARSSDGGIEIQRRAGGDFLVKKVKILIDGSSATIQRAGGEDCTIDTNTTDSYPSNCETPDANGRTNLSLAQIETKTYSVPIAFIPKEAEVEIAAIIERDGQEEVCNIIDRKRAI
jgi:FlaG/FlaF family flagellin (archaellin)